MVEMLSKVAFHFSSGGVRLLGMKESKKRERVLRLASLPFSAPACDRTAHRSDCVRRRGQPTARCVSIQYQVGDLLVGTSPKLNRGRP